jgi:protein translocase SecG subunit
MSLRTGILVGLYLVVSLMLCSFILLMNEDNEGMGAPSIMSPVRSSQKASILQQIIWSLIFFFFVSCITLNRMQSTDSTLNQLLRESKEENKDIEPIVKQNSPNNFSEARNENNREKVQFKDMTSEVLEEF